MTGNAVYSVPEPYQRDTKDTCDYEPPQLSLSTSGNSIVATIRRGSYDIAGYTLYVNGVEQIGISLCGNGVISWYTLKESDKTVKFVITDTAGYSASSEMTVTVKPKVDSNNP